MAVVFKKESVLKVGGYKDFWQFEDYYLWVRMINKGFILHNINETMLNVRFSKSALVRRRGYKYAKSELKFQKKLIELNILNKMEFLIYAQIGRAHV